MDVIPNNAVPSSNFKYSPAKTALKVRSKKEDLKMPKIEYWTFSNLPLKWLYSTPKTRLTSSPIPGS